MRKVICPRCNEEIPMQMCQQTVPVDGKLTSFHIGCAESYLEDEIEVYKVEYGNSFHDSNIEVIFDIIRGMDADGSEYIFSKHLMPRKRFLAMPEFTGF